MLIIFCLLGFLILNFGYCNKVEYDCGYEFKPPNEQQISWGKSLEDFEHPWFCHFDIEYKNEIRHCSGVLISSEDVLTSASCFDDSRKPQQEKFKNISCGMSTAMIPLIAMSVTKQEIFGSHKLALIRVANALSKKPIAFSTHIRPICLTNYEQILEGAPATVVGSGKQLISNDGKVYQAEIVVRNSEKCHFGDAKKNTTLCAGDNFVGIRDGDEGAPLMVFHRDRHYLIGIVTLERGELPGPFGQKEYPILFTRVAPYCSTFLRDHSNLECSSNSIPNKIPSKEYSCGVISEARASRSITRKRAIGENLDLLQPWYCKIEFQNKEICAGTLVSFKHVLTAAHCMNRLTFEDFTVHCGIDFEATSKISKVIKDAEFNGQILRNDIAVIELENEIGFNGKVGAACLIENDEIEVGKNDYLIAVGSDDGKEGTVKTIRLEASNPKNCQAELRIQTNPNTSLCLESESSTTQQGDSGGPLMKKINDQWHVVGIVSAGLDQKDIPKNYLHFTRISGFCNFITKSTNAYWSNYNSSSATLTCFSLILLLVSSFMIRVLFLTI